ncbi:MAG: Ribonucleoside-diphosphate reductase, partial [Candidatus Nomurabacteria bacterium GW2011_GWB1_37_5]
MEKSLTAKRKSGRNVKSSKLNKKSVMHMQKRDGRVVPFDDQKIYQAIYRAFIAVREKDGVQSNLVSKKVVSTIKNLYENKIPEVEEIQNIIINTLNEEGFQDVAYAYTEYRQKRQEIREAKYFLLYQDVRTILTENALKVLESRYLRKDQSGKIIETPQQLFRR